MEVISHWHPNITINIVDDHTPWVKGSVPPPLDQCEPPPAPGPCPGCCLVFPPPLPEGFGPHYSQHSPLSSLLPVPSGDPGTDRPRVYQKQSPGKSHLAPELLDPTSEVGTASPTNPDF